MLCRLARRLRVLLVQCSPKNGGVDDWSKSVRNTLAQSHDTADQVFRAVIEDWESTSGHVARPINVSSEPSGGAREEESLPWQGISAGIDRLIGLLSLLQTHLEVETPFAVALPLSSLMDLLTRILSLHLPRQSQQGQGQARLHPAIDRLEKDTLQSRLPEIHDAALKVMSVAMERMGPQYMSLVSSSLELVSWSFISSKQDESFRIMCYQVVGKCLKTAGPGLDKPQTTSLSAIISSVLEDVSHTRLQSLSSLSNLKTHQTKLGLDKNSSENVPMSTSSSDLNTSASALLALCMSHIPQQHLDLSLRIGLERAAVLSQSKDAMLASLLSPFTAMHLPSTLPHFARAFPQDQITELFLRPRMPLLPTASVPTDRLVEDDDMTLLSNVEEDIVTGTGTGILASSLHDHMPSNEARAESAKRSPTTSGLPSTKPDFQSMDLTPAYQAPPGAMESVLRSNVSFAPENLDVQASAPASQPHAHDVEMTVSDSSDEESVHLNMELDSNPDSDED